jgi:hypothetical protein
MCGALPQTFSIATAPYTKGLDQPKNLQNEKYEGNHNQCVNPIPGAGNTWANVPAKKAKQPQDEQDYDERPQHEIDPFVSLSD